jgi:hypothetical protein
MSLQADHLDLHQGLAKAGLFFRQLPGIDSIRHLKRVQ